MVTSQGASRLFKAFGGFGYARGINCSKSSRINGASAAGASPELAVPTSRRACLERVNLMVSTLELLQDWRTLLTIIHHSVILGASHHCSPSYTGYLELYGYIDAVKSITTVVFFSFIHMSVKFINECGLDVHALHHCQPL